MIAILGGLGAAAAWGAATVCSSRSSRMIGSGPALGWVMVVGLLVTIPAVAVTGVPPTLDARAASWLAVSGVGNVVGLLLEYAGLRIGKVGIVAPIASTEGAIAAVIAVAAGERVGAGTGALLGVIAAGVVLAGIAPKEIETDVQRHDARATLLALGAAVAFGASIYATGRVSRDLPVAWVLLPARAVGVAAVAMPLAVMSRLRLTARAVPLVVAAGLCEVLGFVLFAFGARHAIAVTAVVASQFAAIAALAAYVLFRERLGRIQMVGVAAIVAGVAALGALRP